jgi:Rrf2 family cysteine metabolism transcriptional repressor
MIRFSRREDYSVILVNKLAENYKKRLVPLSEVAKEYNLSILFLRNLAAELRKRNIIKATEGKNGGYYLDKNPKQIKIGDILKIFSDKPILDCCVLGRGKSQCPKEKYCEPGHVWRQLNKEFLERVYNLSLSDFINYKSKNNSARSHYEK